jgi:ribonucleoside-diphosphate reductase alpha chain
MNLPTSISFDDFKGVYAKAYALGLKGCTTYRYDADSGRGAVLSSASVHADADGEGAGSPAAREPAAAPSLPILPRPAKLIGTTYKLKWPHQDEAIYLTINDAKDGDGSLRPFEIFLNTKSIKHVEWMTAFTRMVSAVFRKGGDATFIIDELKQVLSAEGGAWIGQRNVPSLVAYIGQTIEDHFREIGLLEPKPVAGGKIAEAGLYSAGLADCPRCGQRTFRMQEGCGDCAACGFTNCG